MDHLVNTLYFAYGSNLSTAGMSFRAPSAVRVSRARLDGWKLVFRGVANIVPAEGRHVEGAIWDVDEDGIRALDRYEGAPHHYERVEVIVMDEFGVRPTR